VQRAACRGVGVLLSMVMLGLPRQARAQEATLASKLDSATEAAVSRTIEMARTRGLPVDPLIDKALEGFTKHAPSARIAAAVDALLKRLELSRDALTPTFGAREIVAGADALAYGATREALASVRAGRRQASVAVPLAVLTQLVASGVPVARATTLVAELMRRGARDEQLIALSDVVRLDIASGASPEAALDVRTRGLNAVLPLAPAAGAAAAEVNAPDALSNGGRRRP
jgi:hypothetical protein